MITVLSAVCAALILAKLAAQLWLERLNRRHVLAHSNEVPPVFKETVTAETYAKSVQYTLAKSRFEMVELGWSVLILLLTLFSGALPWFYGVFRLHTGISAWAGAAVLFMTGLVLRVFDLPLDWYAQFHLEARFRFNTTTPKIWWTDRLKGLALSLVLGYPLLCL